MNQDEKFIRERKLVNDLLKNSAIHPLEACKQLYENYQVVRSGNGATKIIKKSTREEIKPETFSKGVEGYNLLNNALSFTQSWLEAYSQSVSHSGTSTQPGWDARVYEYAFSDGALKTFDAITTTMRDITQSGKKLTSEGIINSTKQTYNQIFGSDYKYVDSIAKNLVTAYPEYLFGKDRYNDKEYLETKTFLTTMANHYQGQTKTQNQEQGQEQINPQDKSQTEQTSLVTSQNDKADKFMKERDLVNDLLKNSTIHPINACKQLYENYELVRNSNGTTTITKRSTGEEVKPETFSKGVEGYNLLNNALSFTQSWLDAHSQCVSQSGGENEFGCDSRVYEYAFSDNALKTFDAITTTMRDINQSGEKLTSEGIIDSTEQTFEQLFDYNYKYADSIAESLLSSSPANLNGEDRSDDVSFMETKAFLTTMANHYQGQINTQTEDDCFEQ